MKSFLLVLVFATSTAFSQSSFSAIFLLIEPAPVMHGMGGIGVGMPSQDLAAQHYNPANGVVQRQGIYIAGSRLQIPWLPMLEHDQTYSYHVLGAGILPSSWPLQVGISWSRTRVDLGTQERTDEHGNPIGTFTSDMQADSWLVAASYKLNTFSIPLATSIGFKIKDVQQDLGLAKSNDKFTDFGCIISVPFTGGANEFGVKSSGWTVTPSIGYSLNNVGDEISFSNSVSTDPGPRNARLGIAITSSITLPSGMELIGLKYGRAALDYLPILPKAGSQDYGQSQKYQSGLGDIAFIEHVLLGKADKDVTTQSGGEITMLGVFAFRRGHREELRSDGESLTEKTLGYSIYVDNLLGLYAHYIGNPIAAKISKHFSLSYSLSIITRSEGTVLEDEEFPQFTIGIKNIDGLFRK